MRAFFLSLVIMAVASVAADARVRFEGHFIIKASAGTCTNYDPVGTRGNVHFEPVIAGIPDEDRASFVLYQDIHAKGYALKNLGNFTTAFKTVNTLYSGDDFGFDDSVPNVFVRFASQTPVTIAASTNFVTAVAVIQNFDFMPGCFAYVHMAMIQRLP